MSTKTPNNTIIFTDLDGTLLDHDTYSCRAASEMLGFIQSHEIPLIIVTSKTAVEVQKIQQTLNLHTPAIVENGAGVVSDGKIEAFGYDYQTIRTAFERYAKDFNIRGFYDMSVAEVAKYTALPEYRAVDSKKRTFTEPFIMEDETNLPQLRTLADADGLEIVKGGRFYHLISKGCDKAAAITKLTQRYNIKHGKIHTTVALGDGANDITMLQAADVAFLIPKPDGSYLDCDISGVIKAPFPGPQGWNSVLKEYFHAQ